MDDTQPQMDPEIYMPTEAGTATAPDGRRLVFFTVPQFQVLIKRALAARPAEYTYQWGYHAQQKVHVLLFHWPGVGGGGIAIAEGVGDSVLSYMLGTTDVFITEQPVRAQLEGSVDAKVIQEIMAGNTVHLPDVHF